MKNKKRGFTLVELLVVISIIGLLSSMSTVSVNIARKKARDAKRKADTSQIQLALYLYFDDHGFFPVADMDIDNALINFTDTLIPHLNGTDTPLPDKYYMLLVPPDPMNIDPHLYGYNSDGTEFYLRYYLEDGGPFEKHGL